jgi:hypothetical protein
MSGFRLARYFWERLTHGAVEREPALSQNLPTLVRPDDRTAIETHTTDWARSPGTYVAPYMVPTAATLYGVAFLHYGPVDLRGLAFLRSEQGAAGRTP